MGWHAIHFPYWYTHYTLYTHGNHPLVPLFHGMALVVFRAMERSLLLTRLVFSVATHPRAIPFQVYAGTFLKLIDISRLKQSGGASLVLSTVLPHLLMHNLAWAAHYIRAFYW